MSTASVRNLINNQVTSLIFKSKQEIKEQGKKTVLTLKQQIPSPSDLINELKANTTEANCTGKGKEKFDNKLNKIQNNIDKIKVAIDKSLDKLTNVEEKLKKLLDKYEWSLKIISSQKFNPKIQKIFKLMGYT